MKNLRDCIGKIYGKIIAKEDADRLMQDAAALVQRGLTPIAAEEQAVRDALEQVTQNGENILRQIQAQAPNAAELATKFWERPTVRPQGTIEAAPAEAAAPAVPGVPEAPAAPVAVVPHQEIADTHNSGSADEGGSTVNAVHGNLGGRQGNYSVAIFPELTWKVPGRNITPQQVQEFEARVRAAGIDITGEYGEDLSIGTWYNAATGETVFDLAITTTDREQAIRLGAQFNQEAIFDLGNYEEIPTGGTGEMVEGLPPIEQRLASIRAANEAIIEHEQAIPEGPAAEGAPEKAVPARAGEVRPELLGAHEEGTPGLGAAEAAATSPDLVSLPLTDEQQAVVDSLPESQRAAAQAAFQVENKDLLADQQRKGGGTPKKRRSKPVAPEKNKKLLSDLSKYGAFDQDVSTVLGRIANDRSQPRWKRVIARLFNQLGLFENIDIRVVNTPNATWKGLFVPAHGGQRAQVLINLSHKNADFAGTLIHEIAHHGTKAKLEANENTLSPAEVEAKRELEKILGKVRGLPGFEAYRDTSLIEFVAEIFENEDLRTKLDAARPEGGVSIMAQIRAAINQLLGALGIGQAIHPGSLLDEALGQAIKIAGTATAARDITPAALKERNAQLAELANEFPAAQEALRDMVAPQVEKKTAQDYDMSIRPEDVVKQEPDYEAARVSMKTPETKADLKRLNAQIDELGPTVGATKQEIAQVKKYVAEYYEDARAEAPQSQGWVPAAKMVINKIQKLVRGARGINPTIIWKQTPYTYAMGEDGKPLARFADRKYTQPNPAWEQRVQELTDKMVTDMEGLVSESSAMAETIKAQIKWYRDMVEHLRTTFGSLSDFAADILGGLSPQQGVGENWKQMVNFLEGIMKGKYDRVFETFDRYMRGEQDPRWKVAPEKRTATSWKTEMPETEWWPTKINEKTGEPSGTKFSANTANIMMAGLDMWRQVQEGDAPKARNFGLNLIGLSIKATIDRWAGRYLQRMHTPNYRIPPLVEAEVRGEHMLGDNYNLVTSDFGLGQDVFGRATARLREEMPEVYGDLTPADLQAILWFAEKRIWEQNGWTYIRGAENSMMAMAEATSAQRYELGTKPPEAPSKVSSPTDKKTIAEINELRGKINGEANVIGGKAVPTTSVYKGNRETTLDADVVVHPEYDPTNTIGHLANTLAKLDKDAGHISRVILDSDEDISEASPGLHMFFKTRVTQAQVDEVIKTMQAAGLDGVTASIDPRIRPEIVKNLDPNAEPRPFNGVRFQFIPQYTTTPQVDRNKITEMLDDVSVLLDENANIAESRVLNYDTLVLEKGTDYDTTGRLTESFGAGRAKAWTERALRAGSKATSRKLEIQKLVKDRNDANNAAKRRNEERLEKERAAFRAHQASITPQDSAFDGGVDEPNVAAQTEHGDETEPVENPVGGRASLVQAMVRRLSNLGRDQGGLQLPQSEQEVRGAANLGRRTPASRGGITSVWRSLGASFRQREAALHRKIDSAIELIRGDSPNLGESIIGDQLIGYLTGKYVPVNTETEKEINELRKEIPVVPVEKFRKFKHLGAGQEANAYHDTDNGIVYKIYQVDKEGDIFGGYAIGDMRLRSDGDIGISEAGDGIHTVPYFLKRMANHAAHEGLTPQELVAVTPTRQLVFAQPFVEGRETSPRNLKAALARAGVHFLSDKGAISGVAQLPDGRWILYDDLHQQNVRTLPGGRVEIIDANNREMTEQEVEDLETLGKLRPPESPTVAAKIAEDEDVRDETDLTVAPMAARGSHARTGYTPTKWWETIYKGTPFQGLSEQINKLVQRKRGQEAATTHKMDGMIKNFQKVLKKAYGKKIDPAIMKQIMTGLGNLDGRITQQQADAAKKFRGKARETYERQEHLNNVAAFRVQQQAALNALPDEVKDAINVLRNELDLQSDEALKNTGLDTKLRARLTANQGVFLHGNVFKHFEEGNFWKKYITSNKPEAVAIRNAAEQLFKQEVIAEEAMQYQKDQDKLGNKVSNADAIAYAKTLDTDKLAKRRLTEYLEKKSSEPTRLHALMGDLPVSRTTAGKMISLDRENIPKEIRDLWGQYDDPSVAFAKTLSILANHNAQMRFQQGILDDGKAQGYLGDRFNTPDDYVEMTKDKRSPLFGTYGPPVLKESLDNVNLRPVQNLLAELNSFPLMAKTVGSIASWVRNFFGNPSFMVTNGNLPLVAVFAPRAIYQHMMSTNTANREYRTRLIELGVLDQGVDANVMKEAQKLATLGLEYEKLAGFGASITALQRTMVFGRRVGGAIGGAAKAGYTAMDSFWKIMNYEIELFKQKWVNPGLSLAEQEENAAFLTRKTMPTYSNIPDFLRPGHPLGKEEGVKGALKTGYEAARNLAAPYFSFQLEAGRTYASTVHQMWAELASKNPREKAMGAWRMAGLIASVVGPSGVAMAAKFMFGYDDKDEEAVRAGLPDYQKNNNILMLPRSEPKPGEEKGAPNYIDLTFMDPYSMLRTAFTAGRREGAEAGLGQFAKPITTAQPLFRLAHDVSTGRDYETGRPLWNLQGSGAEAAAGRANTVWKILAPGVATSAAQVYEASTGRDINIGGFKPTGGREERTGKARSLGEELLKVFPGAAPMEFDRNEALNRHSSTYRKGQSGALDALNSKMSAEGHINDGEVADATKQAYLAARQVNEKMNKAYWQMRRLGMSEDAAIRQLLEGYGTEGRATGLTKSEVGQIITGNFKDFSVPVSRLREAMLMHPERVEEYDRALREIESQNR